MPYILVWFSGSQYEMDGHFIHSSTVIAQQAFRNLDRPTRMALTWQLASLICVYWVPLVIPYIIK